MEHSPFEVVHSIIRRTNVVPKARQKSKNRNQRSHKDPIARVPRIARHRADQEASRILWPRLLEARNRYIGWQEFNLWVRSILETEKKLPAWLAQVVGERCQGFVIDSAKRSSSGKPPRLRLEDWIDGDVFAFAKREGWFNAITSYAIRDPRYQRAEACCEQCVRRWKRAKPIRYPTFDEWKSRAANSDSKYVEASAR